MSHVDNAWYLDCPRCFGSGNQKADKTREGRVGSIGGTVLHNLKKGVCTFCGGAGKVKVGGMGDTRAIPDNPDKEINGL